MPASRTSNWESASGCGALSRRSRKRNSASKLGVSFQQVQKYEKGVNRVGAARLQAIATALDVPVTFFYDGDGKAREVESLLFLDSAFSLRLLRAYSKIKDQTVQRQLVSLMELIAANENSLERSGPPGRSGPRHGRDRSRPANRLAAYCRARPHAGPVATTPARLRGKWRPLAAGCREPSAVLPSRGQQARAARCRHPDRTSTV